MTPSFDETELRHPLVDYLFLEILPREAAKMDAPQRLWRGVVDAYDGLTDDELLQQLSERLG
jgi:hypothetical protein